MNRLSIIIPVYNGEKYLEKTLESMVTQTVENFEVILVDDGSTDSSAEIAQKYCAEYRDFFYIRQEHQGVYAARNAGIEKAKCEYLLFLDCGDVLTDGSVEAIFSCSDQYDADMITGRCWKNGDIEYEYEKSLDILATQPEIKMLESSLLQNGIIGAKAIRKKLFDLYRLRFPSLTAHGELLLIMQAVFLGCKISGCPEFILEKTVKPIEDGYSPFERPTKENLQSASYVIAEIFAMGKEEIERETGVCDGDEAYCQEILYMAYKFYLENFYRRYWYMDAQTLLLMKEEFEKYAKTVRPERFQKLLQKNPELRLPYLYTDKTEAADEPEFTLFFDITKEEDYLPFLRSLYAQTYPFFELMIPQSRFDSPAFPNEFRAMENIRVLPDENFHTQARKRAKSKKVIEIRSGKPLDVRTLRETAMTRAPAFLTQYVFSQKRQSLSARKSLKDKGLHLT